MVCCKILIEVKKFVKLKRKTQPTHTHLHNKCGSKVFFWVGLTYFQNFC